MFALRTFLTLTTLGSFTRGVRENRDLLVFGGVWALGEILGPNQQKKFGPEKIEKHVEIFFRRGFKKCIFVENGAIFTIFFSFSLSVPPSSGAH